jgi:ribosomal protein L11 methylase PrmA
MLIGLRSWISALKPADSAQSVWRDYAENNSYAGDEARKKADFIREFAAAVKPAVLWDLGCNTGEYSKIALQAGAKLAVGFDFDVGALERAYLRAGAEQLNLLPLLLDATNPSPSQGWAQQERKGLVDRASGGAVLALALVHHLAIARNVPLPHVVDWVVGLAPRGVIEFVPKNDPMVAQLLMLRDDIFPDYLETAFANALQRRARIHKTAQVSATGRTLYWFERT